jgi:monovalent cation:H+ antiporter-2, CPA2 family
MHHGADLIATIAVSLAYAFVGGFVATRMRLPAILGYLVAGIAVGPFTPGFVGDATIASQLAEIGVIMLMFGVGMHFSIEDLWAVRRIALPGAIVQIAAITAFGIALAYAWGWSLGAGIVLGLALSVASTVVMLRALDARGELDTANGRIATGWLVVEDLATVVVLVLLPIVAGQLGGNPAAHSESAVPDNLFVAVGVTLGKVALFVALMLLAGTRFFPWLLAQVDRTESRELFTLAVVALAIGVAYGSAHFFDVSYALGAFFAGVVIKECDLSRRAAIETQPLQDAFAVLFFVSVGMLFDPSILVREPLKVLAVLGVIMVGKSVAAYAIVRAFRYPMDTALTVSASLSQIGEFSFILIALGVSLGLLPPEGQHLALAGAFLSITLNPAVFYLADATARLRRKGAKTLASP